jgi:type IV pilus assembly protein PilC
MYNWSGINSEGKIVYGISPAKNRTELNQILLRENILALKITFDLKSLITYDHKIKTKHIILMLEQLTVLINASTPILKAFDIIIQENSNYQLKNLIISCKNSVAGGLSLAKSFKQHPEYFSEFICSIIDAGEQSGTLDVMLVELTTHLNNNQTQNRKVISALLYPLSVLIITFVTTIVLLVFVIPQFEIMFNSFGAKLPGYTCFIIALSHFLQNSWWLLLGGLIIIFWIIKIKFKQKLGFRLFCEDLGLKTPIINNIIIYGTIYRFTKVLSLTLKAGVPLLRGLNIAANTLGVLQYRKAIQNASNLVLNGNAFSKALYEQNIFPKTMISLIAAGEETGSLDIMLEKISTIHQEKLTNLSNNLNNLLEPVIILILGIIVGGLIIGMYLPIFKLGVI